MAKIIAVCKSEKKGTKKEDVKEGYLQQDYGLAGDAHADCCSHRQVSLLAIESIDKMRSLGFNIGPGDFTFYMKSGSLIENGKITTPIKDVNIIGNGPEVLKRITMVANDMKMDEGGGTCGKNGQRVPVSLGMPSVLVSSITVGGRG